jgi:hypothetical protein
MYDQLKLKGEPQIAFRPKATELVLADPRLSGLFARWGCCHCGE